MIKSKTTISKLLKLSKRSWSRIYNNKKYYKNDEMTKNKRFQASLTFLSLLKEKYKFLFVDEIEFNPNNKQ